MGGHQIMRIIRLEILLITFILCAAPAATLYAESGWNEAGVRMGIPAKNTKVYIRQYDVFAVYGLPWEWRTSSGWGVAPTLNCSLGALNGGGETGFIGSAGVTAVFGKPDPGFTATFGINMSLLDKRHFAGIDFGSILQFGSFVGLGYRFSNNVKIGYRLMHISNGHILYKNGTPNPGYDTHAIELSYTF
jgi:hypothetical protein